MRNYFTDVSCDIYMGKSAGKELEQAILSAKEEVKIVSPYLNPNYVKNLIALHHKGVKVKLITSGEIEDYDKGQPLNIYSLVSQHTETLEPNVILRDSYKKKTKILKYLLLATLIIIGVVFYYYRDISYWPALIIPVILWRLKSNFKGKYERTRIYNYSYSELFPLKVFYNKEYKDGFNLHSKI